MYSPADFSCSTNLFSRITISPNKSSSNSNRRNRRSRIISLCGLTLTLVLVSPGLPNRSGCVARMVCTHNLALLISTWPSAYTHIYVPYFFSYVLFTCISYCIL
ncbi:hypothetical protein BDV93DRAFT_258939 [Ceratobasidium sp. AG-I]|nr:hypothetical protein BDV93DRAFT_258939 [Ceratobasidium sp. AG-I]